MGSWSDADFDAFVGARMGALVRFACRERWSPVSARPPQWRRGRCACPEVANAWS